MVKIHVFRGKNATGVPCVFPEGFTVGEFFCKDFMVFPLSPVRILVNGHAPTLNDCLKDGDEIRYVVASKRTKR